jgi:hypothetical protein
MTDEANWERTVPRDTSWGSCRVCEHFRPDMTCAAYPERIPIIIASGEVDHLVVRPGQIGDYVFVVTKHPTGLALRFLRHAAQQGVTWAIDALPTSEVSTPSQPRRR